MSTVWGDLNKESYTLFKFVESECDKIYTDAGKNGILMDDKKYDKSRTAIEQKVHAHFQKVIDRLNQVEDKTPSNYIIRNAQLVTLKLVRLDWPSKKTQLYARTVLNFPQLFSEETIQDANKEQGTEAKE